MLRYLGGELLQHFLVLLICTRCGGFTSYSIDDIRPQVFLRTANCAVGDVSNTLLKILLVIADNVGVVIVSVRRKASLERQKETHGINSETVDREKGVDYVSRRL